MQDDERAGAQVEFRDVNKCYGSFRALQDFNLTVNPGEFITVLGPSGSGKTTSLMLLAGFQKPTQGKILVDGVDVSDVPPYRRDQGIVFQSYALFPHMSVEQNLAFPLKMRGATRNQITEKVARVVKLVRLEGMENRRPDQLSGGQQQRVALARALVADPPLMLMDEPLGALDKNLRDEMQLEIRRIQQELKMSVLYVTHDQGEALTMSDKIVVMNQGRIIQIGKPSELYERPSSEFVAKFIGDTNLIRGIVHLDEATEKRVCVSSCGEIEFPCAETCQVAQGGVMVSAIRPEHIKLSAKGSALGDPALDEYVRVGGSIRETIYLGERTRYVVQVGSMELIVTTISESHDQRKLVGEIVELSWRTADVVELKLA